MKIQDEYYYYQNDHLGTPQKMTAGNGEVVWSAKYNSFGEAIIEIEAVENNLRFPGQYEDGETGLYYNYYRYYDSDVGRYLRKDPIGFKGGINIFVYCLNNPANSTDSHGLDCGSKWNDWVVPDKPAGFDFTSCCQSHDYCYGNECDLSKEECDDMFFDCMENKCKRNYINVKECLKWVNIYWDAVDSKGQGAFDNARDQKPCEVAKKCKSRNRH
jgi:RHS repeat-associated protein